MDSQLTMYITLVSVSGVFNAFLSLYVFFRRSEIPGARTFIIYTIALSIYSFAYAFELASDTLWKVKLWTVIQYMGMPFAAPLGLMLILHYLGWKVSRKGAAALLVVPSITWLMVATNDYHHLFYKVIRLKENLPSPLLDIEIGEWYIVHGIYTFSCLLAAAALLLSRWKQTRKSYRLQLFTLICGQLIPMVTAFLYLVGATPAGIDPVPMVMCITSGLYIWAILSIKMLTVIPIAKETIFDSMGEGVIVLDSAERLIDYNRAVGRMIPSLRPAMLGRTLDQVWTELTGASFPFIRQPDGSAEELAWTSNGMERFYEVRSSVLRHRNGEQAGSLLMLINVTELKRLQQELEHQAFYDGLTQIFNRTQFIRRGREMLAESLRLGNPFTVMLFDIDFFKRVNDNFGHETGDKLIVHVVSTCRRLLSADMLFARYGGEEFVLALPSSPLLDGSSIAERLRAELEAHPLLTAGGEIAVTASFGVAQAEIGRDETLDTLLRKADEALYASKRNGRNRVSEYAAQGPTPAMR
ncbi:diguanylate cyclase [Cohnella faecalis]|uniref:Diguanylate cyclase n=2 Tax=Cohnella faecalis TaxID=2315694 RepID=A0A398CGT0_9BACL|nr:diguanylate cyclase [Cohnella faecalis]